MISKPVSQHEVELIKEHLQSHSDDLANGLGFLASVQSITSAINPDCIPAVGELPDKDQIRTYFLAMIVESGELLQELNWKPWKADKAVKVDRVMDEFADVLAFMGILLVYLRRMGISPDALAQAYREKTLVNVDRFLGKVPGYGLGVIKDSGVVNPEAGS